MHHPEKALSRSFDSPHRSRAFTDLVYSGRTEDPSRTWADAMALAHRFDPAPSPWHVYFGDLHGHTNLSDGAVDPDTFFRNLRDGARLDFCALTDHDHGGVGREELWGSPDWARGKSKWALYLEKTDEYNRPGTFTTIPGYERDSYPWYSNMVLYYRDTAGAEMCRGSHDGEITAAELAALSAREDVLFGPHTCSRISDGCCLTGRRPELLPKTFEIFSRIGAYEYYDNPFPADTGVRGGNYIDALESGAHPACIACSDDHAGMGGRDVTENGQVFYTGLTGVLARENTREAIFDALRRRRCFAFMGEKRLTVDFRINGHDMGEIYRETSPERAVWFDIRSEVPVARVDLIKNGQSVVFWRGHSTDLVFDYRAERAEDYYYLRIRLEDGRFAWTSPIWVQQGC